MENSLGLCLLIVEATLMVLTGVLPGQLKNNVQLDIFAGKSLNDPATDFFVNWVFQ